MQTLKVKQRFQHVNKTNKYYTHTPTITHRQTEKEQFHASKNIINNTNYIYYIDIIAFSILKLSNCIKSSNVMLSFDKFINCLIESIIKTAAERTAKQKHTHSHTHTNIDKLTY